MILVPIRVHRLGSTSTNGLAPVLVAGQPRRGLDARLALPRKVLPAALARRQRQIGRGVPLKAPWRLTAINSNESAAIGMGNRIGSVKVGHIDVTQLWLQDKVSQKLFALSKVGIDEHLAAALAGGVTQLQSTDTGKG